MCLSIDPQVLRYSIFTLLDLRFSRKECIPHALSSTSKTSNSALLPRSLNPGNTAVVRPLSYSSQGRSPGDVESQRTRNEEASSPSAFRRPPQSSGLSDTRTRNDALSSGNLSLMTAAPAYEHEGATCKAIITSSNCSKSLSIPSAFSKPQTFSHERSPVCGPSAGANVAAKPASTANNFQGSGPLADVFEGSSPTEGAPEHMLPDKSPPTVSPMFSSQHVEDHFLEPRVCKHFPVTRRVPFATRVSELAAEVCERMEASKEASVCHGASELSTGEGVYTCASQLPNEDGVYHDTTNGSAARRVFSSTLRAEAPEFIPHAFKTDSLRT